MKAAEAGIEALGARGRHADRRAQQPAAVGARQADVDDGGVPRRRRRAAPGRPGRVGPDHAAGPDQPRLRRRADDHGRRRHRAARHRHGHRRQARDRGRAGRRVVAAAGDDARGRASRSCSRSPAGATCRCGRSTRRPGPSRRPRTRTRTSSSARWSTRSSRTRCGSPSSRPATARRARPREEPGAVARADRRAARAPRPSAAAGRARRGGDVDVPEFIPRLLRLAGARPCTVSSPPATP